LISELTAQNEKLLEHQAVEEHARGLEQKLKTFDTLKQVLN